MTTRAEIQARLAAATPGPWFHRQAGEFNPDHPDMRYDWIGDNPQQGRHNKIIIGRECIYGGTPDYALIAHAPTDLAYLDAELTKAMARVERLEAALRKIELNGTVYDNMKEMRDAAREALEDKP